MKTVKNLQRRLAAACFGGLLIGLRSSAQDADFSRAGSWELSTFGQYLKSGSSSVNIGGTVVSAELDSVFGGGLAVGYNLTDHFTWNLDAWGGTGSLKASALGVSSSTRLTVLGANTSVDWNILKTRFTPLLSANVGLLNFSGDAGGVAGSETDYAFGVGGGVRWDFSDRWFAKAVYRMNWSQLQGFDDVTQVHSVTLGIGYRF